MRWLLAIVVAALLGGVAYDLGLGAEVAYIVRAITRYVLSGAVVWT